MALPATIIATMTATTIATTIGNRVPSLIDRFRAVPYAQVAWSTGLRLGAACHLPFATGPRPAITARAGPLFCPDAVVTVLDV